MKSPCLKCYKKHTEKNDDECRECKKRIHYLNVLYGIDYDDEQKENYE